MGVRIGIDAGLFPPEDHGGLAVYRRELVRALAEQPGEHELFVYGRNPPIPRGMGEGRVVSRDWGSDPLCRVPGLFRQVLLPRAARRDGVDLLHFPLGGGSLVAGAPSVVSVHDLLCVLSETLDYPVTMQGFAFRLRKRWHRHAIPASLRRARLLIASSAATRADLHRVLGIGVERVKVVPLAAAAAFAEPRSDTIVESFLSRLGLTSGYVLGLASVDPRKNVHRLLDGYARLSASLRSQHALVVLLTQPTYAQSLISRARRLGITDRVRLVPHLDEHDMPSLYQGAATLAFPSLFEGFGLPVLESMWLGVPVVASSVGGIPEVGGDAVEYVDPLRAQDIARGLERVLTDRPHAERLRERGSRRAREFTWERTAAGTLAAYREALS